MKMQVDEVMNDACSKHQIDEGRDHWQQNLENDDVRQSEQPHRQVVAESLLMFEDSLQRSERPAEALAHQAFGIDWRLSERERLVFVNHLVALFQKIHREVRVFGDGIDRIAAAVKDRGGAPCADGSGDNRDHVEQIEGPALEVLAGDVFKRLPACPEVDTIA